MRKHFAALGTAAVMAATGALATGCGSGDDSAGSDGPVELTYWAWAPGLDKAVATWNKKNPDIKVTVQKQASGDDLVTKILTAAKANKAPDLIQAEYQALPTLISNDVVADISGEAGDLKSKFPAGIWQQVTLGSDALYALPQDSGPMMFFYRKDLFKKYGLEVPATWDDFAEQARDLKKQAPDISLTTFAASEAGQFAGLAQQAGAKWWTAKGEKWNVAIDAPPAQKVADFWGGLVKEGAVDNKPMYTPAWNKALNTGKQISWVSAVWAPGVLSSVAPDTKGKWAMAPLPQWSKGDTATGSWGGSSTGVTNDAENKEAATEFATWLNTDPEALAVLNKEGGLYPAATAAQKALKTPPAFFADQTDFYPTATKIAQQTAPGNWGPNVNVAYQSFKDGFSKAAKSKGDFGTPLTAMQSATVKDLKKLGFEVSE
ncbi:ABC transporter substrate-binding protein [Streptomyces boninensis]|uniref:ABC transporter substrate-binding protein n=1 Tax=Streptomyces boninensis TaxID=2039455 RepID=UPI003B21DA8C